MSQPIDIHCSKIVDWLVQRRHCKKDWGENLDSIRRKIKAALADMPEHEEIKLLLIGSKLDYFKSKRVVEILQTTEASTKGFFGYYSSQRMKDWQDIVRCYERNCIYMAEVATDLIRETNYEIPGIRKHLNKLKQEKEDVGKERANLLRRAQQFTSEHQKIAQSYGIAGYDVQQELIDKSKSLSSVMDEITLLAAGLQPEIDHYRNCSKVISKQDSSKFLSMLDYVIQNGNTTVDRWKCGEEPQITEADSSGQLILELRETRNQFLNNLHELEAFFNQTLFNLSQPEHRSSAFSSQSSAETQRYDEQQIEVVINKIKTILRIFNRDDNKILFLMNDSPLFVENLRERLASKLKQADDCASKAETLKERMEEIDKQIRDTELNLKKSIAGAKELQGKIESSLTALYGGRPINIMGCVS